MRVDLRAAGLLALALVACREESGKNAELFDEVVTRSAFEGTLPDGGATPATVASPAPVIGAAPAPGTGAPISIGANRSELMKSLGACAQRIAFVPASPGGKTVEVYQPRPGNCAEQMEQKRYMLVGGVVAQIDPGLDTAATGAQRDLPPAEISE